VGLDLTGLGAVADTISAALGKFFPDKTQVERDHAALALAALTAQTDINKAEAANPSVFVAGWRPSIGWVCSAALAFQYIARPLLMWGFSLAHQAVPVLPGIDDNLWQLMLGMLGLGGLRTFEKVKGVA
jgi:hypothetical protein